MGLNPTPCVVPGDAIPDFFTGDLKLPVTASPANFSALSGWRNQGIMDLMVYLWTTVLDEQSSSVIANSRVLP